MDLVETYDRAASGWDKSIRRLGYHEAYAELVRDRIVGEGAVLDVGCGTGAFSRAWIASGGSADLTLLDSSQAMLAAAERNLRQHAKTVRTVHSRLEEFRPSGGYTTILAAHVLEHLPDPAAGLARLAEMLLPSGRLILSVSRPHWCNWIIWLRFHHRWFPEETVQAMAFDTGLKLLRIHRFANGPPSRTSLGYVFVKTRKEK